MRSRNTAQSKHTLQNSTNFHAVREKALVVFRHSPDCLLLNKKIMEFENHASNSNAPSPCVYMTAPTSPNGYSRSSSMEFYYSAPASPRHRAFKATDDNLDEFEFATSKRFSPVAHEGRGKYRERGDSLPAMAFADELFLNGQVMPLKPPPRLHCDAEFSSFSLNSPLSSPKSPRTVCRIPFARKSSWNDDFDPFMVALEKVREEKREGNSHHRRSRSYSPFRAISKNSSATADCHSQELSIESSPMEPMPLSAPSYSGPLDFKGSAYARWVRDQTRHGLSPKSPRGFFFRQRVRPLKTEQDGLDKPASPAGKHDEKKCGNVEATKVQKLKGLLVRYASFRRGNGESKQTKTSSETRKLSYFSRLSFKLKGNAHSNNKKKIPADAKLAVVQYKPSISFCLGYGVGSTMKVK